MKLLQTFSLTLLILLCRLLSAQTPANNTVSPAIVVPANCPNNCNNVGKCINNECFCPPQLTGSACQFSYTQYAHGIPTNIAMPYFFGCLIIGFFTGLTFIFCCYPKSPKQTNRDDAEENGKYKAVSEAANLT